MAFSSVTIGNTSQSLKPFWYWTSDRVAQNFSVPYNSSHRSPKIGGAVTPVVFVAVESLVNGGTCRFGVAESNNSGAVYTGSINAGGGSESGTRNTRSGGITKTGRSGRTYRAIVLKTGGSFIGMVRQGAGTNVYVYNSSWGVTSSWDGPSYMKIYYNTVPSQVTGLSATVDNEKPDSVINLSWSAPSSSGGSGVNGYKIQWSKQSNFSKIAGQVSDTRNTSRKRAVTGLDSATQYYFRVAALNAVSDKLGSGHSGLYSSTANATTAAGSSVAVSDNATALSNFLAETAAGRSAYVASDAEGNSIPPDVWISYGGDVRARVVAPGQIELTLVGPRTDIPGFSAPYSLSVEINGSRYPALSLHALGVMSDRSEIDVKTGASEEITVQEIGTRVNNVGIGDRETLFERAAMTTSSYNGSTQSIRFTVPEESQFAVGTVFLWEYQYWRVMNASISNGRIDCVAEEFTLVEDVVNEWDGEDIDQQVTEWDGLEIDDIGIMPLYRE